MNKSKATVKYEDKPHYKIIALIEQDIIEYYYKYIPKCYYANRQAYPGHITILRSKIEKPLNLLLWKKHQDKVIEFEYEHEIFFDGIYFYIKVYSKDIGNIRTELGLPEFRFNKDKNYHITIGNVK